MPDTRPLEELLSAGREALEDERFQKALEEQRLGEECWRVYVASWAAANKAVTDEYPALEPYIDIKVEGGDLLPAKEFDEVLISLPNSAAILVSVRKAYGTERYEIAGKHYTAYTRSGGYQQPITVNHWVKVDTSDGDGEWAVVVGGVVERYGKNELLKALAFAGELGGREKLEAEIAEVQPIKDEDNDDEELPF